MGPMVGVVNMAVSIPSLVLSAGAVFKATVQSIAALTTYVLQPCNEDLLSLSAALRFAITVWIIVVRGLHYKTKVCILFV